MDTQNIALLIAATLVSVGIYFAPQLLRFRILVLRKFRWNWLAEFHENHFSGIVIAARILMAAIATTLFYIALA